MKAQRLLAILTLLLNRKKVSAAFLAHHFEVSQRTIYRDVDALAEAGIPVFATTGRAGGFELVEGFTLGAQILETGEVQQILAGLNSLSAVIAGPAFEAIKEKFSLILKDSGTKGIRCPQNHIFIELTPSLREKKTLELIEREIETAGVLQIDYGDGNGIVTKRMCEPLALVFIWQSWYVYAYCRLRSDFRMFKVSRILDATTADTKRISPPCNIEERPWMREWESKPFEQLAFTAESVALAQLREFFDDECIENNNDGRLTIHAFLPVDEWVTSFLMRLPGNIVILEPESMKNAIHERAYALYKNN